MFNHCCLGCLWGVDYAVSWVAAAGIVKNSVLCPSTASFLGYDLSGCKSIGVDQS